MDKYFFLGGCVCIMWGLFSIGKALNDIAVNLRYNPYELIKHWHKVTHESRNYYTPIQRTQDPSEERGDDSPGGSCPDRWME